MKTVRFIFCLLTTFLLVGPCIRAQGPGQHKNKVFRKLQKTTWVAGVSGMVIDDDAKAFTDLFDVNNTWNFLYFPSRVTLEGYHRKGLTFGAALGYGQITKSNRINDLVPPPTIHLITFDAGANFYLREFTKGLRPFSPYIPVSFGYTFRSSLERKSAFTANIGVGVTFRMSAGFGINLQSLAKFALNNPSSKNYLQHTLGLVYCFDLRTGPKVPLGYKRGF